jgi:hypothetical protein
MITSNCSCSVFEDVDKDVDGLRRGPRQSDPRVTGREAGVTEKKMFGGLAFLVDGHMAVGASGQGGLMVRVDPAETAALVRKPHAGQFEMRGCAVEGWLRVTADGVRTKRQLEPWITHGVTYAR